MPRDRYVATIGQVGRAATQLGRSLRRAVNAEPAARIQQLTDLHNQVRGLAATLNEALGDGWPPPPAADEAP
ncbi:hypothetical protein [Polymorphospora sp. NPDC050346]|uniref:hypothetical protein n=1 Tax=Polymorphospora sp. NPDC050346 TaxID=3155780 RepID=UPI0033FFE2F2